MFRWLILAVCFSQVLWGEIEEIHQLSQLEEIDLKSGDWVLFDIDYTLVQPENPTLQMCAIKQYKHRFKEEVAKLSIQQQELLPALMVSHGPNQLMESDIPAWIQRLREKNITVYGLTLLDTSMFPTVGFIPHWRANELKRLGIEFSTNSDLEFMELFEFPSFRGTFPLFSRGILFCNSICSKGEVLSAFLAKTASKPSRVFFVDDTFENLRHVQTALDKLGIPFKGFHYKPQMQSREIPDKQWRETWDQINLRAQFNFAEGILPTGNVEAIKWACQSIPEDALVIFDIGNVLFRHKDAVLREEARTWIKEWYAREGLVYNQEERRALAAIIDRHSTKTLVNSAIPGIIQEAKKRSKVIALSKFFCGPIDEESTFEEQRLHSLKELGIEFKESFPNAKGWCHEELRTTYGEGLIQTEALLKGPVLTAFLDYVGWQPKAILFVDDRIEQCESIFYAAKEQNIPVLCIHYTEAFGYPFLFDPTTADLQLRTLVHDRRWVSEDEVQTSLNSGP